ncbi:MAG: hypothetical protein AVDCRST_MAG88-849 [uncultured Thermomicrobiales bacterium]|uniref:cAMP-binding proteins - catabolite gene activator and regulatory subunit of cAMP-dependent protein kinases n=1 Tax=uncultured Thermomicrobiales bacterium TaxID=1645740 RepID=A0A6J4UND5_9BACT|nr:MAG: hypothetical protein AVDCRST_MAG88-849 [uncultured Thermomicrobiales bacterium]
MSDLAALRRVPFLAVLPETELARLADLTRPRQYRSGTTIFHREDPGATLHIIHSGRVKLVLASPEGREVTVDILGMGDFFGELALLDGGPRSASAVALDQVETFTLDRQPFIATLERHPEVASGLLTVLGDRLRRTDELIQDILFLDLPARLAKQLLALADEFGTRGREGVRIEMRLNQSELASIVGATRESVNRCLNAFAERDLIALDREAITILKLDELRDRIY